MIVILDTHPVQYRAPLYRELERTRPGEFMVIYGSDFSVRGYRDADFGHSFAWDVPLLEGYAYVLAGTAAPHAGAACWNAFRQLWRIRPRALLLMGVHGPLFWTAYFAALVLGCELWLRSETQDHAFPRSWLKSQIRSLSYRIAYLPLARVFYIGELNREHYLRHGVPPARLARSPYATVDAVGRLTTEEKHAERARLRQRLGIAEDRLVVSFFGKLVAKKNPGLLLEAMAHLPAELRRRTVLLLVGSGDLEADIRRRAGTELQLGGATTILTGFINQSGLPAYYLAADVMVLPSRQAGETWGLVVNEALQAGCAVIMSREVGCAVEFAGLPRVSVIESGDAAGLAAAIFRQARWSRDFDWASGAMRDYSVETAARGIVEMLDSAVPPEAGRDRPPASLATSHDKPVGGR